METWLLTWNPKYYDWSSPGDDDEQIDRLIQRINAGEHPQMEWSCGVNKKIQEGDRLYIMRLGVEPKGIVASGTALSATYAMPHWDPVKAASGEWRQYIKMEFDKIRNADAEKILPLGLLRVMSPETHWTPICSGMHIINEVAEKLEAVWSDF